jgi:hypothetical protein
MLNYIENHCDQQENYAEGLIADDFVSLVVSFLVIFSCQCDFDKLHLKCKVVQGNPNCYSCNHNECIKFKMQIGS